MSKTSLPFKPSLSNFDISTSFHYFYAEFITNFFWFLSYYELPSWPHHAIWQKYCPKQRDFDKKDHRSRLLLSSSGKIKDWSLLYQKFSDDIRSWFSKKNFFGFFLCVKSPAKLFSLFDRDREAGYIFLRLSSLQS